MKINLKALTEKEIEEFVKKQGQSPYRAKQIINWIYKKYAASLDEMTDLSKSFRENLNKIVFISNLKLLKKEVSKDGTQKFLFELVASGDSPRREDGETIESVLIPDKDRLTLCISSQVGCAMGCKFCITGKLGLKRNLKAYEIVDQIISVSKIITPLKITNIVLMGMGEPLHNFDEVIESLWRITTLLGFSKRRVTLSTVGIAPKIFELAKKGPMINLAISLNATTDSVRNKIMPVNQKYPLKSLIEACRKFPLEPRRRITLEYVLLHGINDSKEDALRLISLLKGIRTKVNLIPYNPSQGLQNLPDVYPTGRRRLIEHQVKFRTTPEDKMTAFQKILQNAGITTLIRKSKGSDISAACGQLKASYFPSRSLTIFKSS